MPQQKCARFGNSTRVCLQLWLGAVRRDFINSLHGYSSEWEKVTSRWQKGEDITDRQQARTKKPKG